MRHYIDFAWKADRGSPLAVSELESWESTMREAMGGSGWVVMRQIHGVWHVEEAELTRPDGDDCALKHPADRRQAIKNALLKNGKAVR
jgi:SH3-like domain-containing protein